MAATAVPTSTRFYVPGQTTILWLPTIAASTKIPTSAEITAGDNLTGEVADLAGFTVSSNLIGVPDASSKFTKQIDGRTSVQDSSLTFYASKDHVDVRGVLARGDNGFIVFSDSPIATGAKVDVFPARVTSVGAVRPISNEAAATLTVMFGITDEPAENLTLGTIA